MDVNGLHDNFLENMAVNLKYFSKMCLQSMESRLTFQIQFIYIYIYIHIYMYIHIHIYVGFPL